MIEFELTHVIAAPRETVFEVLTDYPGYAKFLPMRRMEIEREGSPEPAGIGAIRRGIAVGPPVREEIVDYVAPERLQYRALSGLPVRDHLGTVTLTDLGGRTEMKYRITSHSIVPGTDLLVEPIVRLVIGMLAKGIKSESERRS